MDQLKREAVAIKKTLIRGMAEELQKRADAIETADIDRIDIHMSEIEGELEVLLKNLRTLKEMAK